MPPRPVLLEGATAAVMARRIACKYPIRVLCYLGRYKSRSASREDVWSDIRVVVRHVRYNHPSVPVLLGGHGQGANLAINYGLWKEREPVQALVREILVFLGQT